MNSKQLLAALNYNYNNNIAHRKDDESIYKYYLQISKTAIIKKTQHCKALQRWHWYKILMNFNNHFWLKT